MVEAEFEVRRLPGTAASEGATPAQPAAEAVVEVVAARRLYPVAGQSLQKPEAAVEAVARPVMLAAAAMAEA